MVRRICIDSDVLIAFLNNDTHVKDLLTTYDALFSTTAVNAFEVWYGRKPSETVSEFLSVLQVVSLDDAAARLAADMLRELKKQGKMIDLRDLFIGAICITNMMALLTGNKKHFERLQPFGLLFA